MAEPNPLDLTALVASRICHDLLNSAGAMANALELLDAETDETMRRECASLLRDSAAGLTARLRYFRLAFGGAGDSPVEVAQLRGVIAELAGLNPKLEVATCLDGPSMMPRPRSRLLLCLALVGIEALPRGGTIEVEADEAAVRVTATGARVLVDEATLSTLRGAGPADASKAAAAFVAHAVAAQLGVTLTVEGPDNGRLLLAAA